MLPTPVSSSSDTIELLPANTLSEEEKETWERTVKQVFGTPDTLSLIVAYLDQADLCKLEKSCRYLCLQARSLITHFDENDIPQSNFEKLQQVVTNRPEINTLSLHKPYTANQLQLLANQLHNLKELDFQDTAFLTLDLFKSLGSLQSKLKSVGLVQNNIPIENDNTLGLQDYFLPECQATELKLCCNHEINQSWLDNLPINSRIESLTIVLNKKSLDLNNLDTFKHLKSLNLQYCEISENTQTAIAQTSSKLKQLHLLHLPNIDRPGDNPALSRQNIKKIIKTHTELQQLALYPIEVDDDLIQLLSQHYKLEHLVLDDFSNNQAEFLPIGPILLNNPNIKVLCLLNIRIGNETIEHILQLKHLEGLSISIDLDYEYNWENLSKLFERLLKSKSLGLIDFGPHSRLTYQHPDKHLMLIFEQNGQSLNIPNIILKTCLKNAVESVDLCFSFLDLSAIDQLKQLKNLRSFNLHCIGMPSKLRIKYFIELIKKIPSLESISFSAEFDDHEHDIDLSEFHLPKLRKFIINNGVVWPCLHQPVIASMIDELPNLEELEVTSGSLISETLEESIQGLSSLKKLSLPIIHDTRRPGREIFHIQNWVQSLVNLEALNLDLYNTLIRNTDPNFYHKSIKEITLTVYFSSTITWEPNLHTKWFECCKSFIIGLPNLKKLELGITDIPSSKELKDLIDLLPNKRKTSLVIGRTGHTALHLALELNITDELLAELLYLENIKLQNLIINSEALQQLRTAGIILE